MQRDPTLLEPGHSPKPWEHAHADGSSELMELISDRVRKRRGEPRRERAFRCSCGYELIESQAILTRA